MSKYQLKHFKRKDGTIEYFICEYIKSSYAGGFKFDICDTIFYGTKEECEKKLEELRKEETSK